MKLFLTCDPGTRGTAFAVFCSTQKEPIDTKLILGSCEDWNLNRKAILLSCEKYLERWRKTITDFYIEEPQFMEMGQKGITSARSGSLHKLTCLYGALIWEAEKRAYNIIPVPIPRWKGQRSKKQVDAWIHKQIDKSFPDHVADAVGIGLWIQKKK